MARISIKNIAEIVGASPTTVSLVLNGKDQKMRISQALAKKIRDTAKELNYMPNMSAISLRTRQTKTIGLIIADISNPFFAKLARYIENIAAQKGYQVIFGSSDESLLKFQNLCNVFVGKGVDGMIVVPPLGSRDALSQLVKRKMPLVVVDREPENIPINTVMMDNLKAAYALTTHLIEGGCKKIGLIGHNKNFSNVLARFDGYKKALADNNLEYDPNIVQLVELENFELNIEKAVEQLLRNKIDSIFFITGKSGKESLLCLRMRKKIEKFTYASIDLFDECRLPNITLHCIEQPLDVMSEKALSILFKQMEDPKYQTLESVILYPSDIKSITD